MDQTNHFINLGYGWMCKHCSAAEAERQQASRAKKQEPARPKLQLASWTDSERNALICLSCGIQEIVR